MRRNEIRFLKVNDPLAVRFTFEPNSINGLRRPETQWFPARVDRIECESGRFYPILKGATSAADGMIQVFHSGVVDEYSAEGIVRLPREVAK